MTAILVAIVHTPLFEISIVLWGVIPGIVGLRFGRRRLPRQCDAPQVSAIVAVSTACRAPGVGLLAAGAVFAAVAAVATRTAGHRCWLIEAGVGGGGDALHVPGGVLFDIGPTPSIL